MQQTVRPKRTAPHPWRMSRFIIVEYRRMCARYRTAQQEAHARRQREGWDVLPSGVAIVTRCP